MEDDLISLGLHVKEINEAGRYADFTASTAALDSYGERVEQVWRLERYLSNPVVLFAHKSRELPIGRSENVGVGTDGNLAMRVFFATEKANPLAEQVWQCVREKTLRTVSVGFIPHSVRYERENDKDVCVLSDNELFELSVTPVPANPEALAKMRARARDTATTKTAARPESDQTMLTEKEIQDLRDKSAENAALKAVAEKAAADATEKLKAVTLERDANANALKSVTTERDELATSVKASNDSLARATRTITEHKVDDLVGKKFAPAERDVMLELAISNMPLFEKTVALRPDMHLTDSLTGITKATPTTAGAPSGDAFAEANAADTAA